MYAYGVYPRILLPVYEVAGLDANDYILRRNRLATLEAENAYLKLERSRSLERVRQIEEEI